MAFKISFAAKSDLGLKRKINEDSYCADEKIGLFMVLDGIGGHKAGEVASNLGLDTMKENVMRGLKGKSGTVTGEQDEGLSREAVVLNNSIALANKVIYEVAHSREEYHGMGTTLASLLIGEKSVAIAHVGDSRIYLIRKNLIERLTEDHSLVMEQLRRGLINEEDAERSEMKNIITRALGAEENVHPTIDELVPAKDDIFLLCSDGLTDLVSDEEILNLLLENRQSLDRACQHLIDQANARGGKDNITTILVNFQECPNKIFQYFFFIKQWFQKSNVK
ncbi:MAG: Stp1/IreP family PP2C-type Ser/Thr phosphatase [Pseudomonadota bacterium]